MGNLFRFKHGVLGNEIKQQIKRILHHCLTLGVVLLQLFANGSNTSHLHFSVKDYENSAWHWPNFNLPRRYSLPRKQHLPRAHANGLWSHLKTVFKGNAIQLIEVLIWKRLRWIFRIHHQPQGNKTNAGKDPKNYRNQTASEQEAIERIRRNG